MKSKAKKIGMVLMPQNSLLRRKYRSSFFIVLVDPRWLPRNIDSDGLHCIHFVKIWIPVLCVFDETGKNLILDRKMWEIFKNTIGGKTHI